MSEQIRILYVEDDAPSRMLVKQVLTFAGYKFFEAEDGMAGIRMAQEAKPDLILMDVNMPGLDGHEAATKIKSLPGMSDLPIIAVTANVMEGDRERALTAGCDGYLAKPIDVDALPDQITEFLRGRRERVDVTAERDYLREYSERLVDRLEEKVAELTVANEKLQRSDELKSRFISIAAHELRTPITIIRGYMDILMEPAEPYADPNIIAMLQGISGGVKRLHEIVQDMLDVTRIEAGTLDLQIAPVRLAEVAEKSVSLHRPSAERRDQTLTLEPLDHLPIMWGDGGRILQILNQIIGNAVKYTPNGGSIKVGGRVLGQEAPAAAESAPEGSYIELSIADTGVGIDTAEQERIFEPFYEVRDPRYHSTSKTDFMGGGAGLGLSIARGVAEAHGGWIWVESDGYDPERCPGSCFHVVLPLGSLPKH